jgi:gliding motility-associated-like protein
MSMKTNWLLWAFCVGWLWLAGQTAYSQCGANEAQPQFSHTTCGTKTTIAVAANAAAPYDAYRVDWGDGSPAQIVTPEQAKTLTHTYTDATPHRISVSGQYFPTNCGGTTTKTTTPSSNTATVRPPVIGGLVPQGGQLAVPISNPDQVSYYAERRIGSEPYTRATENFTYRDITLQTRIDSTKLLCYRIVLTDPCLAAQQTQPEVCYYPPPPPPPSATVTVPPATTVTVPPSATVTVPPSVTITVPPAVTVTVPPSATVTVPPAMTVTEPPTTTITVPPSPTVTVPPSVTTVVIPASPETNWFFPTAFTPNNDGLNDTFGPVGNLPVVSFRLVIFDRWGIALFDTTDPVMGWDGRTGNGQPAPPGPYPYRADWQENAGNQRSWRGSVLLLR